MVMNNSSLWYLYLKKLSVQRAINSILVIFSYCLSKISGKVFLWGQPIVFTIEPAAVCQLSCPECLCGQGEIVRDSTFVDLALFEKVIHQIKRKSSIVNLFFQGEPFLHPEIITLIKMVNDAGLVSVISTNAQGVTNEMVARIIDSKLDILIVSVDGDSQDTFEKYRKGGHFESLVTTMKDLVTEKKSKKSSLSLVAQCLITKDTEPNLEKIKRWTKEIGFKFKSKTIQIYSSEDKNELLPSALFNRYISPRKKSNSCFRLWTHMVILTDGRAVPCCMDKNGNHVFCNIKNQSLENVLESANRKMFVSSVSTNRSMIDICRNCPF
jgi:radical SAM protein with 4Fe4S-binding SPASM domain